MTDQAGGPPLADTSDMLQVHQPLRDAVNDAPRLLGGAVAGGAERVALVGSYYANVLEFLKVHHEGEDELVWPLLCERVSDEQAAEVRRIAGQHALVTEQLESAIGRVEAFTAAGDEATAADAEAAIAELASALIPHLDEEESYPVPLAAQHLFAPEWGQLPGHAMRSFAGDKLWLILGLIREQFRPEQIARMEANMPPPVLEMWTNQGQHLFREYITELRAGA